MTLRSTVAIISTIGTPLVVLYDPPTPYIVLALVLTISILASILLGWVHKRASMKIQQVSSSTIECSSKVEVLQA